MLVKRPWAQDRLQEARPISLATGTEALHKGYHGEHRPSASVAGRLPYADPHAS